MQNLEEDTGGSRGPTDTPQQRRDIRRDGGLWDAVIPWAIKFCMWPDGLARRQVRQTAKRMSVRCRVRLAEGVASKYAWRTVGFSVLHLSHYLRFKVGPSNMHRLGGAGLAAFDRQTQSLQSFAALSTNLNNAQIQNLHSQLSQFRTSLSRFAQEHRNDIQRDPAFRQAFQQMCSAIGVDPLAGPRKGGWWAELLGISDWQYELGVQIVDICVSTRDRNGGMIEMGELLRLLSRLRGVEDGAEGAITEDDIVRSIKTLHPLGAGYQVVEIGGGKSMVRSVVKELDTDQMKVLELAQTLGGWVDANALMDAQGWSRDRAITALDNMLIRDGLCWIDEQDQGGSSYWVPSVMQWND